DRVNRMYVMEVELLESDGMSTEIRCSSVGVRIGEKNQDIVREVRFKVRGDDGVKLYFGAFLMENIKMFCDLYVL
ncbi:hypothetical protein PIB30_096318, partial [Stylosanthes scabra]|nr:hypothetical protein [Stylosanthes scabra]